MNVNVIQRFSSVSCLQTASAVLPKLGKHRGTAEGVQLYYHPTHTDTSVKQYKINAEQIKLHTSCKERPLYHMDAFKK